MTYFWMGSHQTHTLRSDALFYFAVIYFRVVFLPQATYLITNTAPLVRGQAEPWRLIVRVVVVERVNPCLRPLVPPYGRRRALDAGLGVEHTAKQVYETRLGTGPPAI